MFFYFCFTNKWWHDQLCRDTTLHWEPWDLIASNWSHFLVLWEYISRRELYEVKEFNFPITQYEKIGRLVNSKTLELIHWMVYFYYTNYRAIVNLFVPHLWIYAKQELKTKTMKSKDIKKYAQYNTIQNSWSLDRRKKLVLSCDKSIGQTLVVFPDMLSLLMRTKELDYILVGSDAQTKLTRYYYDLQNWNKNILITTSANICMDYKQLSQIICYFPDTRYYKYQQDPRIFIPEVLQKMAEIHGAHYTAILK